MKTEIDSGARPARAADPPLVLGEPAGRSECIRRIDLPAPDRSPDPRIYNASFYVGRQ